MLMLSILICSGILFCYILLHKFSIQQLHSYQTLHSDIHALMVATFHMSFLLSYLQSLIICSLAIPSLINAFSFCIYIIFVPHNYPVIFLGKILHKSYHWYGYLFSSFTYRQYADAVANITCLQQSMKESDIPVTSCNCRVVIYMTIWLLIFMDLRGSSYPQKLLNFIYIVFK